MQIDVIKTKTAPIFKRHNINEAYLFGSVARGDDTEGSDIDILARFQKMGGLFGYMKVKHDLEDALGRTVDLVQIEALRPEFKERVDSQKVRLV